MGILSERFLLALVVCVGGIVMGILSERFLVTLVNDVVERFKK